LKFTNTGSGLYITIDEILLTKLNEVSLVHFPNEFGGLLIGNYSLDRKEVFIKDTVLPKEYSSSKYSFYRGIKGLKTQLQRLYKKDPCQYYIGEWHSHPDNLAIPSGTDLQAFQEIVSHTEVFIENPILLILGGDKISGDYSFYVFYNQIFLKYEKEGRS
jgi:[CysO sulfur-carrier protein]-S-L-cysteine hydrolase